ncbi:MAG: hypothetical protein ACK5JF_07300 [Oscillospiraceae bacterium]
MQNNGQGNFTDKNLKLLSPQGIALAGVLGALLLVVQVALAPLPNIELVSIIILVSALHFKTITIAAMYIFVLGEGLIYGFHIWWICYLYVWLVLFLITCLFFKVDSVLFWSIINGLFGLLFGALCSIPYFFIGGVGYGISYFIAGVPFDLLHCTGNFATALLLYKPLDKVFAYVSRRKR